MNGYQRPHTFALDGSREGLPRRWSADEFEHMVRAGIVNEAERLELIAGAIVQMWAKGNRHELMRSELTLFWARRMGERYKFTDDTPLRLSERNQPDPDILLFPASQNITQVTAGSVLLVVEISDSSLSYDLKIKGPVYAALGVREYWVIDPHTLETTVHHGPGDKGYAEISEVAAGQTLTPLHAPELAVRLAGLGIEPDTAA